MRLLAALQDLLWPRGRWEPWVALRPVLLNDGSVLDGPLMRTRDPKTGERVYRTMTDNEALELQWWQAIK